MIKPLNIRAKLIISFCILLAFLSVVILMGHRGHGQLNQFIREMYEEHYKASLGAVQLNAKLNGVRAALVTMMAETDKAKQAAQHKIIKDLTKEIDGSFDALLKSPRPLREIAIIKEANEAWVSFRNTRDNELIPAIYNGRLKEAKALALGIQKERYDRFASLTNKLVDLETKEAQGIMEASQKAHLTLNSWFLILASLSIIAGIFMAILIIRAIATPLMAMANAAQRMASGDLDVNVSANSRDEFGILAGAFNKMVVSLKSSREEQRQLYEGEQRKVQQMAVLHEAVAAIASHLKIEPLLEQLASLSALLVKAELSALVILHPETGAIQHFKANISPEEFPVKTMPKGRGLLGAVLRGGSAIRLDDASSDPRFEGLPSGHPFIKDFLAVPMILKDKVIGGIYAANKNGDGHFTGEDESLLLMLAFQSATAVENARLYTKTAELATTDGLTGLLNRRAFMERLTEEAARSSRYEHYFSFLLIDIDHFKRVNDTYGHPAGDAVLKLLAQILKRQTRTVDIVGRYGGEEFTIILPETNSAGAKLVGERIRSLISKMPFPLPDGNKIGLTVSMGIACFPNCADNIEQLIERADNALYSAKREGRNRVYLYRETLIAQMENNPEQIVLLLSQDIGNIEAVISAMDVKASFFREHTEKVRQYAMLLSQGLGIKEDEKDNLRLASLLHDIGFVATPTIILRKAGNLTDEEEAVMKQHPAKGAEIIKKAAALAHLAPIIHSHHERYDGTGYPDGLKGDDIPYLARVIAVADAYASMTSSLPWRKALSKEEALKEIQAGGGLQFDPEIVKVFCRIEI